MTLTRRRGPSAAIVLFLVALTALVTFVTVVAPGVARADDVADEADHLFSLGAERYQANDFKGALQYFLASNRLVRNRNVEFNIARSYEHLRQFPDAYRYYQRALEDETDAGAKGRIKDAMGRIQQSVALLKIETDPPGATVYLDRKDLGDRGKTPQTMALASGTYTVIAELEGYEDARSKAIEVRTGSEKSVSLKLTRIVGTLRLTGAAGASVHLDTEDSPVLCVVPCEALAPPGQHTLVLTKPGFRTTRQTVQIKANAINAVKTDIEAETGSLIVNADEKDAAIDIDGKTQGFTPTVLSVPVGKHDVRVTLRGFRPVERNVVIKANEQTQLDLELVTADSVEAASRAAEPVEDAPASVSLIPAQELRGMAYPTLVEAVRGVRGVYVTDDSAYASIGFRGFSLPGDYGNRTLVLIDGLAMTDNWVDSSYVGYDLRTDLDDIERIEVVRGPGSVLYGTGAFSGVINLVTTGADAPDGREVGLSAFGDVARGRVRLTQHWGKDAGVWTSVAAGRGGGHDIFVPEYVGDSPPSLAGTARNGNGFKVATLTGRVWWKSLTAQWGVNVHDKRLPPGEYETLLGDDRTHQRDSRAYLEAKFTPKLGDQLDSLSRVHVNYYQYRGFFARSPADGGVEGSEFDGSWVGAEQRFIYRPIEQVRLTGGGEAQLHYLAHEKGFFEGGPAYLDDNNTFEVVAGYGLVDFIPSPRVKVSAGARVDAFSTFGASINPRVALIVKPYERGNLKILAGKAFRAPSIYELFYLAGGGQKEAKNTKPESLYSLEVEYSHRFSRSVIGTVSTYANYIRDLIALRDLPDATPTNPSYAYQNSASPVGTLGAEAELRREWKEGWMVAGSYAYQQSRYLKSSSIGDFVAFERAAGLREVPNSPNHLASLKGAAPILGRALLITNRLTFAGLRYDRNDDATLADPQRTTPSALLWDVVFTGQEPRWGLTYSVGVYNAFDTRWTVPVSSEYRQVSAPQPGRTLLAQGSIVF
jgi:outer membrane receptor protein involved in Fe transport